MDKTIMIKEMLTQEQSVTQMEKDKYNDMKRTYEITQNNLDDLKVRREQEVTELSAQVDVYQD